MRITLSVIKADIGSIGGHIQPSKALLDRVRDRVEAEKGKLLIDVPVSATGDDTERYVIESVHSRATGHQAAVACTSRLHNIAGKYTGKDDPVMLVRVQKDFPATGEMLAPFAITPLVAGGMRGSHNMPLMPVPLGSVISYFDGPPAVTCAAFCVHEGRLTEPVDAFAHPFWNRIRDRCAEKAVEIRRQGLFGAAMLPMNELEYTGVTTLLAELDGRFTVRT